MPDTVTVTHDNSWYKLTFSLLPDQVTGPCRFDSAVLKLSALMSPEDARKLVIKAKRDGTVTAKIATMPNKEGNAMHITIEMDEHDFQLLTTNSMEWGPDWQRHDGRFEHTSRGFNKPPRWVWKMAYWVSDSWTTVILARSWLQSQGHACEIMFDLAEGPTCEYLILTDYVTPSWAQSFEDKAAILEAMKTLDPDDPSPVKRLARRLGLHEALVASVFHGPGEPFVTWHVNGEPDLPPGEEK